MSVDRFQRLENEYFALRGKLEIGRITRADFEAALKTLVAQDDQGHYWTLDPNDGKWLTYDGKQWIAAEPPASAPLLPAPPPQPVPYTTPAQRAAPAPAQQSGGWGCGRLLACGCVVLVVLCVVAGGAGFWAYQTKAITLNTALNLVGQGPGAIEVDNFRDDGIQVTVTQLDSTRNPTPLGGIDLSAFDVKSFQVPQPGRYRVEFATAGRVDLDACTLSVRGGDRYQFVTLPDKIVVNHVNNLPSAGRDIVVGTSALCR